MASAISIEQIDVRRHNGHCAYGPWMEITDEEVPSRIIQMVADELADDEARDEIRRKGMVSLGGSSWLWRIAR